MTLLLCNPLERVERACNDEDLRRQLQSLLGTHDLTPEHWDQLGVRPWTPLLDVVKLLKCPSWRLRSEVLGLANIAVDAVTKGRFNNVDEVRP
jgi:hypothetical protein